MDVLGDLSCPQISFNLPFTTKLICSSKSERVVLEPFFLCPLPRFPEAPPLTMGLELLAACRLSHSTAEARIEF